MIAVIGVVGLLLLAVGGYVAGVPLVTQFLPISPIFIGAAVTAVLIAVRPKDEPLRFRALWPVGILFAGLSLGFFYAETGQSYAAEKVQLLLTLTPLAVLGGVVLLQSDRSRRFWLNASVLYAIFVGGLLLIAPGSMDGQFARLAAEGQNTIAAGRAPAAAVVVLVVLALAGTRFKRRVVMLGAAVVFAGLMLAAGSRGPLAACILAIAITAIVLRLRGSLAWSIAAGLGGVAAWMWVGDAGYLSSRLTTIADASAQARLELYSDTSAIMLTHPLGVGWGQLENQLPAGHAYPHNLFLEVGAEAGWIALVALLWFIGYALRRQARAVETSSTEAAIFGLTVFFLASAMVSGDINSHRGLWVMLGACLTAGVRRTCESGDVTTTTEARFSRWRGTRPSAAARRVSTRRAPTSERTTVPAGRVQRATRLSR